MPARSQSQQIVAAIAEHDPSKLYPRNSGMASMGKQSLHDFASTPRSNLPYRVPHKNLADGCATPHMADGGMFVEREGVAPGSTHWMELVRAGTIPGKVMPSERAPLEHMADGKKAGRLSDAFAKAGQKGHSLHDTLNIPRDKPIPKARVRAAAHSSSPKERHQAQAALNMNLRYYGEQ